MPQAEKAKVFMNGRSQAVRIPLRYRFASDSVYIRRDKQTGDLILSEAPAAKLSWSEIFAALDAADIPKDFLEDRDQGIFEKRIDLIHDHEDA